MVKDNYTGKTSIKGSIDLGGLAQGIYFIKVNNNSNQSVYRVVKQ
jgi:hypothetical protein